MALTEQDVYDYKLVQQKISLYTYEMYLELLVITHLPKSPCGLRFSRVDLHSTDIAD
jgi:hypothetical protein